MTKLGLGCVGLGSGSHRLADDVALVREALDLGVTVFDTADAYGAGASERTLAAGLRGRRDEVVLATKGGFTFRHRTRAEGWARRRAKSTVRRARRRGDVRPEATAARSTPTSGAYARQDFSPAHLRHAVHESLRRLRTDRIDVYQLHAPAVVLPDLFTSLVDLVAAGDVGCFGVGAGSADAAEGWLGVPGLSVVQLPFGVLDRDAATTTLPRAARCGVDVWARGVLGGGLLSLVERDPASVTGDPKARQLEALRTMAEEAGTDVYRLALAYVRQRADISTVLVGTTSPEHLARNIEHLHGASPPTDVLDELDRRLTAESEWT